LDSFKTNLAFKYVFKDFVQFIKQRFGIRNYKKYFFIVHLHGNIRRTTRFFSNLVAYFKFKVLYVIDRTGMPHNGCRASKKLRRKNRRRNRFIKKSGNIKM